MSWVGSLDVTGGAVPRLQVFATLANEFWIAIIVPGTTVIIVMLTVSCLYCTLRLHGILHPLVYACFPFVAVFLLTVVVVGIFGQLAADNRGSRGCVEGLEMAGLRFEYELTGTDWRHV